MSEDRKSITPLQLFTLSYLYSEELKMAEKEEVLDSIRSRTHHSHSSVLPKPIAISVREIATKVHPDAIGHMPRTDDILEELFELEEYGYLEEAGIRGDRGEYTKFSITTDGIIYTKNIFSQLFKVIENKKEYEKRIDKSNANKEAKEWLKGLWITLKNKAQDEITDEILLGAKKYGTQAIGMAIALLNNS